MKNQIKAAFGTRFFAVLATLLCFLVSNTSVFATEVICKMTMCGTNFTAAQRPNILKGKSQTIRVFVKFGDLVERATAGVANVTVSIGAKQGFTVNPCDTYIDINITPTSNAVVQNSVVITLFGAFNTETCRFNVDIMALPFFSDVSVRNPDGTPVAQPLVAGRPYLVTATGGSLDLMAFKVSGLIESATKRAGATPTSQRFDVVFKTTTPATLTAITFEENLTTCNLDFSRLVNFALDPKPDLISDGVNRKYGIDIAAQCSGISLGKLQTNNSTLDIIKGMIPAPSANEAIVIRDIVYPNIRWGVKNVGGAIPNGQSFTIKLMNGNTVLQTQTITTGLAKNAALDFTYVRPKSNKKLFRALACNGGNDVYVHEDNATIAANNWADPTYTVKVDTGASVVLTSQIGESDENNNSSNY